MKSPALNIPDRMVSVTLGGGVMHTTMSLRYSGPAVDAGEMDVNEVAASMVAFSNFVASVTKVKYGTDVRVSGKVSGFSKGSFVTDFAFEFGGVVVNLLGTVSADDILSLMRDSFSFWKHLNGKPPANVVYKGKCVEVENNKGVINTYNIDTLNVVMNETASSSVERMVKDTLSREGIDTISLYADKEDEPFVTVDKVHSSAFAPVPMDKELSDFENEMTVVIESPSFKNGNKWKVNDGRGSFYVSISDEEFLARVEHGEQFAKGDALRVILNTTQIDRSGRISADHCITKVIEHKHKSEQQSLL